MKRNLFILLIVVLLAGALPISVLAEDIYIDIKPDDEDNLLTVNRKSALPVAIYYGEYEIDLTSLTLNGIPAVEGVSFLRYDYVLVKFDSQAVLATLGEVEDGDVFTLTLEGALIDGTPFEATDSVTIRARGN